MRSALPPSERAEGLILACCARPLSDVVLDCPEIEGPGEIRVKRLVGRVAKVALVASGARIELELPEGQRFLFRAGQHVDVLLPGDGGRMPVPLGAPAPGRVIALEPPGGCDRLRIGDMLRFEGPFGG